MQKSINDNFKKVYAFNITMNNPFTYRGNITWKHSSFLLKNIRKFRRFYAEGDATRRIALNSEAIMDTEERLGVLLKKLINFHGKISYDKESISLE